MASTADKPATKTTAKTKAAPKETTKARAPRRRAPTEAAIATRASNRRLADPVAGLAGDYLRLERIVRARLANDPDVRAVCGAMSTSTREQNDPT